MADARDQVRQALLQRDNIAMAKCCILFPGAAEAERVLREELEKLDPQTRRWWMQPCDFPLGEAEDAVIAVTELLREGKV